MKLRIFSGFTVGFAALSMIALATTGFALRARADGWDKKTVLKIDEPIQISDTYLQPGTYVLKLLDSQSDRHIVRIMNADETRLIDTQLAIPNYRLQPTGHSRFQFWETPPGSAKALRAWFYPGDNVGEEFLYPKHLHTVAMLTSSSAVAAPAPQPAPAPAAAPQPAPEPAPAPQPEPAPVAAAPAPAPEPAPAPAPVNAEPAPAPEPAQAKSELPKTATLFPLFGLGGFLAAVGYGVLRSKGV